MTKERSIGTEQTSNGDEVQSLQRKITSLMPNGRSPDARKSRYELKVAIQRLADLTAQRINDVVDALNIHRHTYWYSIDTVESPEPPPKTTIRRQRRKFSRGSELTAVQKLELLNKADLLRQQGLYIPEICDKLGIDEHQHLQWDINRSELATKAREERDSIEQPIAWPRRIEAEPHLRQPIVDTVAVMKLATGQNVRDVIRQIGVSYHEITTWEEQPILSYRLKKVDNLKFTDFQKARVAQTMDFIGREKLGDASTLLAGLGLDAEEIKAMARLNGAMRKMKAEKEQTGNGYLTNAEALSLQSKGNVSRTALQSWCKAWKMQDVAALASIPEHYPQRLRPDDLAHMWVRLHANRDDGEALNELSGHYLPLVDTVFTSEFGLAMDNHEHDLKSDGGLTLLKCLKSYDLSRNIKFITYLVRSVQQVMGRKTTIIRYGTTSATRRDVMTAKQQLFAASGREPTVDDIHAVTGGSKAAIKRILQRPMETPMADGETHDDFLANASDHHEADDRSEEHAPPVASSPLITFMQSVLEEREIEIMLLRCAGETLEEIGPKLGVTKERIRQLETRSKRKLRAAAEQHAGSDDDIDRLGTKFSKGTPMDLVEIAELIASAEYPAD